MNIRFRSAVDESVSNLACAITRELPLHPVTAEDGRIYERAAIEEWFKRSKQSPCTHLRIGTRLLPALQVRAAIESLVRSGALAGETAGAWQARVEEEEEAKTLLASAEGGDAHSMLLLSDHFFYGTLGFSRDAGRYFCWADRAAKLGDLQGMTRVGWSYLNGVGVARDVPMAILFLAEAATEGDFNACWRLGEMFELGTDGMQRSGTLATRWFTKVLRCGYDPNDHLCVSRVQRATEWLRANSGGSAVG